VGESIPTPAELTQRLEALAGASVRPWKAVAFRYVRERYADAAILMNGAGSWKGGGRWNAPGAFHAVYLASTPELAHREYLEAFRLSALGTQAGMPFVGQAVALDIGKVLDLRSGECLAALSITLDQVRADTWKRSADRGELSLCQHIGAGALALGVEALLVPSARGSDISEFNIVLILENCPDIPPCGASSRMENKKKCAQKCLTWGGVRSPLHPRGTTP